MRFFRRLSNNSRRACRLYAAGSRFASETSFPGAPAADRPSAGEGKPTKAALLKFLSEKLAKWQLSDDVVFVDALPHTATGKLLKTELRQRFHGHLALKA